MRRSSDPRFPIRNLKISSRYAHPLVEREGAGERDDRLVRQPLSEVEDAEVVVRARIRRIDSAGERSQDVDLTAVSVSGERPFCRHQLLG